MRDPLTAPTCNLCKKHVHRFMTLDELNGLTYAIIQVAMEVHDELGPGLLENVYQHCLKYALEEKGFKVEMEVPVPVVYHGHAIAEIGYRMDLLVNETVVIELKSANTLLPIHLKQLGTYLRLANKPCGLLINFNVKYLKDGIRRSLNGFPESSTPSETSNALST